MTDDEDGQALFLDVEGLAVLSRTALMLHTYGSIHSINDGHPGFVTDDYLNAISPDTTTSAVELEAAGLWARREGGYFIVADDSVRMLIDADERRNRREAQCQKRGEHVKPDEDDDEDESGWVSCTYCGITLQRPDGGPVALPNGGPLGPDPRDANGD